MLDADAGPLVMSCLRCWDEQDELIEDVVWFNPSTMMAAAGPRGTRRVHVGRYCFRCFADETADQLREALPLHLHCWIEQIESPRDQ